jgi:hypothetical protein
MPQQVPPGNYLWKFSPMSNQWTVYPAMPSSMEQNGASIPGEQSDVISCNGNLYLVSNGDSSPGPMFVFNPIGAGGTYVNGRDIVVVAPDGSIFKLDENFWNPPPPPLPYNPGGRGYGGGGGGGGGQTPITVTPIGYGKSVTTQNGFSILS